MWKCFESFENNFENQSVYVNWHTIFVFLDKILINELWSGKELPGSDVLLYGRDSLRGDIVQVKADSGQFVLNDYTKS